MDEIIERVKKVREELKSVVDELFPEDAPGMDEPWCTTCGFPASRKPYGCPDVGHAQAYEGRKRADK